MSIEIRVGRRDGERGRLDLTQLRRAWAFTRRWRPQLLFGMIAVAIASVLTLALPLLARDLFNEAFGAQGAELVATNLNGLLLLMLAIFVVQALFNFLRTYLLGVVGEGIVADMRRELFGHVLTLSLRFFEERRVGEITSRLTSDVATVQVAMSQGLAQLLGQAITLVGGVVVLLWINPRLTLLILAVVPVLIVAAALFGRFLRGQSTRFQDAVAEANASADEAIAGIRVVKSFVAEGFEAARYSGAIDRSFVLARSRAMGRALFLSAVGLAMMSGIALVLWFGGRQVLAGALLPGDLVAFLILTIAVAGAVGTFTGLYSQFQEAIGASRRIFDLLDLESDLPDPVGSAPLGEVQGRVAFQGVDFAYEVRADEPPTEDGAPTPGRADEPGIPPGARPTNPPAPTSAGEPVLNGISLEASPGQVVALVGPSGAGKSTLIMLIARFYDPTVGRILLDGRDLREISLGELRSHVGVVFQETQLFSGSIRENIRYGRPGASDDEVREAAAAANALEFIEGFPEGMDTLVGERGVKLSGGQRQRVAIARALLKNPRILVLDEATSALDSESEALVQEALDVLMQGRTTFVIAHRLSTIVAADQILVIDRGRIVQNGTHGELASTAGLYRDLYERQYRASLTPAA